MMISAFLTERGWREMARLSRISLMFAGGLIALGGGCAKQSAQTPPAATAAPSQIQISETAGGTIIATPTAEFVITPSGYVTASLESAPREQHPKKPAK